MIKVKGYPEMDLVKSKFPNPELLVKPKAILECYQEIPCNPCSTSCPFEAITIGSDINQKPVIDYSKCTGCGMCVYSCPGLAIIVSQILKDKAIFKIPYEMLPRPEKGETWLGINRQGKVICDAHIENTLTNNKTDRTVLVTVSVPIEYLYDFITIRCPNE